MIKGTIPPGPRRFEIINGFILEIENKVSVNYVADSEGIKLESEKEISVYHYAHKSDISKITRPPIKAKKFRI